MTSNPMAQAKAYEGYEVSDKPMTIVGTINKTVLLLTIAATTALFTWNLVMTSFMDKATVLIFGGMIVGLILAIATSFKPKYAAPLSIGYAFCEGFVLGGISALYAKAYSGIIPQAVGATLLMLFIVLTLYRTGAIKATEKFRSTIIAATLGIMIFYLINFALSFFMPNYVSIFQSGILGIGISAVIVVIAALNFILDFDFIEKGTQSGVPKYFEWYGAFALLVTLIWLYFEILRLISLLRDR